MDSLFEAVKVNTNLEKFVIKNNPFNIESCEKLVLLFRSNYTITSLDLENCQVPENIYLEILSYTQENKNDPKKAKERVEKSILKELN